MLVSCIMIEGFKLKQSLFRRKYKRKQLLIEDYSLLISKLPQDTTVKNVVDRVTDMLSKSECSEQEKIVVKVYFLFNVSEYIALHEEEFETVNKLI